MTFPDYSLPTSFTVQSPVSRPTGSPTSSQVASDINDQQIIDVFNPDQTITIGTVTGINLLSSTATTTIGLFAGPLLMSGFVQQALAQMSGGTTQTNSAIDELEKEAGDEALKLLGNSLGSAFK